jgi:hypothetical protein
VSAVPTPARLGCLAGCSHPEPFRVSDEATVGPFATDQPVRLPHAARASSGGGRLFISEQRGVPIPGIRPQGEFASISEILPDGTTCTIDSRRIPGSGRWGRIAASRDGRQLVAELHFTLARADLYLLQTGP